MLAHSAYEQERQKNIQRNKERLKELGLLKENEALSDVVSFLAREDQRNRAVSKGIFQNQKREQGSPIKKPQEPKKRYSAAKTFKKDLNQATGTGPLRASRRVRGEKPEFATQVLDKVLADAAQNAANQVIKKELKLLKTFEDVLSQMPSKMPKNLNLPMTLPSIGTTVWELGSLVTDGTRDLYWSSAGVRP
jgi:hypothetical protein